MHELKLGKKGLKKAVEIEAGYDIAAGYTEKKLNGEQIINRKKIFEEIEQEMNWQDKKWGGPRHDDKHTIDDWRVFIEYYLTAAKTGSRMVYRRRMKQIASLAIQACISFDRVNKQ